MSVLLIVLSSLVVPRGVVGASKLKMGIGKFAASSPPPHISCGWWISLLVHASKYVVVVGTVCITVLVPVKLSVTVILLEMNFVRNISLMMPVK